MYQDSLVLPVVDGWSWWYNEQHEERIVGYNKKTQYQYHDAIYSYSLYRWTGWTEISETKPADSNNREIQHYYSSRTRTITRWYTYSKWSDYSQPTTEKRTYDPNTTKEKVTKTEYRYKKK